jgi:hypothetical protein
MMSGRYFTKSIFQAQKIEFLHFIGKHLNVLRFSGRTALRLEHPAGGGGILHKLGSRPDGSCHQIAPAIGTDAFELFLGAGSAEGAFIGADARLRIIGGKIAITAFAIGPQFQHGVSLSKPEAIMCKTAGQCAPKTDRPCRRPGTAPEAPKREELVSARPGAPRNEPGAPPHNKVTNPG